MVITPKGLMLSMREFNALPEYSCTVPTGTVIGKKWKRRGKYHISPDVKEDWFLGEYVASSRKDRIGIKWTKIDIPDHWDLSSGKTAVIRKEVPADAA